LPKKLTVKQKLFCKYYLISLNATYAAIKAGYSKKTARQIGTENLAKPNIEAYIQEQLKQKEKKLDITVDRVLEEIALIAFLDIKEFYNENGTVKKVHEIEETARRAISTVTTKEIWVGKGENAELFNIENIKAGDKLKALEMLGRYLSMFKDNLEVTIDEKIANWMKQK
jgi:phage terminase small subunit